MAICSPQFSRSIIAAAALAAATAATAVNAETTSLAPVTITGNATNANASVAGFGGVPLSRLPMQASVVGSEQLKDGGIESLADITRFDASVSDAYNAAGYWSNFTIRGFVIDQRYNYRRDGLPINAETSVRLANKERIEILKGTSGIQAGTSAPGGLVNLVVKRPEGTVRSAIVGWQQDNTWGAAVDLGQRFGADDAFGVRLNVSHTQFDPQTRDLKGRASLVALAGDWRVSRDTLIEAEFEISRKSQPSLPGMSLLGNAVPDPRRIDPRTNLNNQPWSQPVVLDGNTATLRVTQRLNENWSAIAHLGTQQLKSDDRLAFPYGCIAENNFDRYCSDGSFDLYDYRSENERRRTDALDLGLRGKVEAAGMTHGLEAGVLLSRFQSRYQGQAYNLVGVGNIDGSVVTPADPSLQNTNTNLDQRSTELYLRDAITLTPNWTGWFGLRNTHLHRDSVQTDGSEGTGYPQSFTTPWLALSYAIQPGMLGYVSWGQGIESEVAPARSQYKNQGQALPPLKSRQFEAGIKRGGKELDWNITGFDISKPLFDDVPTVAGAPCDSNSADSCTRQAVGTQHHVGVEAAAEWKLGSDALQASAMLLRARVEGGTNDGKQPTNVAQRSLRLNARHDLRAIQGLSLTASAAYEGSRMVLPDNSASIPGWTRFDAAARFEQRLGHAGGALVWRAGIDNLANKRAWKESPYEFTHAYLYPMAPRTLRFSVEASL